MSTASCRYVDIPRRFFLRIFLRARKIRVNLNSMRPRRRSVRLVSDARDLSLILNRFSTPMTGVICLRDISISDTKNFRRWKAKDDLNATGRAERLCRVTCCRFFHRVCGATNSEILIL